MSNGPVSPFPTDRNYLKEMALYLESRGLTIQDIHGLPFHRKNHGLHDKGGRDFMLEGWAYLVKGPDGLPRTGQIMLRPCNYPDPDGPVRLFHAKNTLKEGVVDVLWEDRPKFIYCSKEEYLYYASLRKEIVNSEVVGFHEKMTSATLMAKNLGVPSLAFNGCHGWACKGGLTMELRDLVKVMAPRTRIVVCFDGDITHNPQIYESAKGLKGAIATVRPDIVVVFPKIPGQLSEKEGWDDWYVRQGSEGPAIWMGLLSEVGITVYETLPLDYLQIDLEMAVNLGRSITLVHSMDNYERALSCPRWDGYRIDFTGDVYLGDKYSGGLQDLFHGYRAWLERAVYCTANGGKSVSKQNAEDAFNHWSRSRTTCMAIEILRGQDPVSYLQAREAAASLAFEGLGVVGPMTKEQTIDTILMIFRDTIARWSDDPKVDVQWVWSLIGPSGCGKSKSNEFMFEGLEELGYRKVLKGEINKTQINLEEEVRRSSNCPVVTADDYSPGELYARDIENMLYALTTMRTTMQRALYDKKPSEHLLRAIYFLSTTDQSREFIRSAKNSGERRFIPMDIVGTEMVSGMRRVSREVLSSQGLRLLVWAAQEAQGCPVGQATQFSEHYIGQYVRSAPGTDMMRLPNEEAFDQIMAKIYRAYTNDWRFSIDSFADWVGVERLNGNRRSDLVNSVKRWGAEDIGKARVTLVNGKEVVKDRAFVIKDMAKFKENMWAEVG